MTTAQAARLAESLELDLDELPVCLACLSFVSFEIDTGDEPKIRGAVFRMTPDLWADGLELPAWRALESARDRGVAGAREGLGELAACGPRSRIARAIVRVLGQQLADRAAADRMRAQWALDAPDDAGEPRR